MPEVQPRLAQLDRAPGPRRSPPRSRGCTASARELLRVRLHQDFKNATDVIGAVRPGRARPARPRLLPEATTAKMKEIRAGLPRPRRADVRAAGGDAAAGAARTRRPGDGDRRPALARRRSRPGRAPRSEQDLPPHRPARGSRRSAPEFDWDAYFAEVGAPTVDALNVTQPDFFADVSTVVRDVRWTTGRPTCLGLRPLRGVLALPKRFVDENFAFRAGAHRREGGPAPLEEAASPPPIDALGRGARPPVRRSARSARRARRDDQGDGRGDRGRAFEANLDGADLDGRRDARTAAAREAAQASTNKIGYPDKWRRLRPADDRPDELPRATSCRASRSRPSATWRRSASRSTAPSGG